MAPDVRIHLVGASFGAPPAIFGALKLHRMYSPFSDLPGPVHWQTFIEPSTEWAAELFSKEKRTELDRTGTLYMDSEFCIGHRLLGEMEVIQPDQALEAVTQQVTVVHGDKDSMVPYRVSVAVCSFLRNVHFVTLVGADHGYMKAGDDEGRLEESVANQAKSVRADSGSGRPMTTLRYARVGRCDIHPSAKICEGAVVGKPFRPSVGG